MGLNLISLLKDYYTKFKNSEFHLYDDRCWRSLQIPDRIGFLHRKKVGESNKFKKQQFYMTIK